jgi:RsiW-degrading membrane proteinase PrsW (M82 family)
MDDRGTPLSRRSVWVAQGITIVGLILYVLVVRLLAPTLQARGAAASAGIGIVMAAVPVLLWLLLFYVQDAREPEPLGYVLRVAVGGAILAGAVAIPLLRQFARTSWLAASPLTELLLSILVVGSLQEFCKYAAVRFTVFESDEFDEVGDGVTYGTAAGLGLATMVNLTFILESPSIAPVPAALRIVVTSLAHAASGGVLGYFLGRAKMLGEDSRVVWGLVAAAVLNGVVAFALREVTQSGLSYRPWNGLALAAAVAAVVTLVLFRLVRPPAAQPST